MRFKSRHLHALIRSALAGTAASALAILPAVGAEPSAREAKPAQHHFVMKGKGMLFPNLDHESVEVKLSSEDTEGRYTVQDEHWHPGFTVPPHFHKEHAETFYLMDGQFEWTVGGETHLMNAGDLVYIPPNTVHSVHVVGNKDAHVLFIFQPGGYEKYEIREGAYTEKQLQDPKIRAMLRKDSDFHIPK